MSAEHGGKFIRERRESRKLSTYDVVEMFAREGIHTSVSSYAAMERGATEKVFDPVWVRALSRILNFRVVDLLIATGYIDTISNTDAEASELIGLLFSLGPVERQTVKQFAQFLIAQQQGRPY